MQSVTIKDVALDADVSTATVSRVLNSDARVSVKTKQKVESSIQKLRYSVNSVARSLKVKTTKTVAVIAPELSNDFFVSFFTQLESELYKQKYTLLICSSNNSVEVEAQRIAYLADRMIDGLIAIPVSEENAEHYRILQKKNIPLVFVDRNIPYVKADSILVDNEEGSYQAVCALIRDGYRRIAFIGGDNMQTARERYNGYERALSEHKLPIEKEFVLFYGMSTKNGYEGMSDFLKMDNRPDSVFFANLMTQIGAAERIMKEPLSVQRQLYCAGFDTTFYLPLLTWCKYAVRQPITEIGIFAAKMIFERITGAGTEKERHIRMSTKLIDFNSNPVK